MPLATMTNPASTAHCTAVVMGATIAEAAGVLWARLPGATAIVSAPPAVTARPSLALATKGGAVRPGLRREPPLAVTAPLAGAEWPRRARRQCRRASTRPRRPGWW